MMTVQNLGGAGDSSVDYSFQRIINSLINAESYHIGGAGESPVVIHLSILVTSVKRVVN